MDDMQSWSSFEEHERKHAASGGRSGPAAPDPVAGGIDALHVSSASPGVAPAAASLLRHSGLTASSAARGGAGPTADGVVGADEEFRFRFHWMRPHPSLAVALDEELRMAGVGDAGIKREGGEESARGGEPSGGRRGPAAEAARLMEAYVEFQARRTSQSEAAGNGDSGEGRDEGGGKSASEADAAPSGNATSDEAIATARTLPLELPDLRVNLAGLVHPPLMTAWLPGGDAGSRSDSENEEDDINE